MNFYITWFLIGRTIFFAPVIRKSMIKYFNIFSSLAGSKKGNTRMAERKEQGILRPQDTKKLFINTIKT